MTGEPIKTTTALRKTAQQALARLEAVAPLICADDDPEDLHNFRVTIRRTRSILGSFHKQLNAPANSQLRAHLKELAAKTDRLRDLDVLLDDHAALCQRLPTSLRDGCPELASRLYAERSAAHAVLVEFLVSEVFTEALAQCRQLIVQLADGVTDQALQVTADQCVPKRIRRLQRRCLKLSRSASDYELHQLRIAGKKMRYMLDFLEPVLPQKKRRRALKALKQAQDDLGRFHDLCVQQELFETLLFTAENTATLKLTLTGLVANVHARRTKRRNAARKTAVAFNGSELASLCQALESRGSAS